MEDLLAKIYLAIVFFILLVSTLFLGYQIRVTQQLEKNLEEFRSKRSIEKNTYENIFKLGQLYLRKKIYNKAIEEFRVCFREWDKNDTLGIASLFNTLGFTYYQLKEYEIAVYYYKIALTLTPDYITSLTNLAYLYQNQNKISEVENIYKKLILFGLETEKMQEIKYFLSRRNKNSE